MARPTELAENSFSSAQAAATDAVNFYAAAFNMQQQKFPDPRFEADLGLAKAIMAMSLGLKQLSIGVRATYILLEEIRRSLPPH